MSLFNKISLTKHNYINLLFSLIPVSFIAGNLILNINILLLLISSLIFFKIDIFKINNSLIDKLILFFFSFVLFTGFLNNINTYFFIENKHQDLSVIIKTISFLRFLLLYLVIRYLIFNKIINFKLFFISVSFFSLFVSFDIFYQFLNGKDIFGLEGVGRKFGGPFGDELIAGGYIQRFSIFTFFLFPVFFGVGKDKLKFLIPVLFLIFFIAIIISGNRMPLILFLLTFVLIFLFEKKIRKYFFWFLAVVLILFITSYNLNSKIRTNFQTFYGSILSMSSNVLPKELYESITPSYWGEMFESDGYAKEFGSFYYTWKMNKYIGGGIKSFRRNCHERENIDKNLKFKCNTHPHNYYLEILTDLGVTGFLILSAIFLLVLYKSFKKKYFNLSSLRYNHIITPFMFVFLIEIFPIRSSGSFFTTGNSTFIFLILAVTIALFEKKDMN